MTSTLERFSFFPQGNDSDESKHVGNIAQLHTKLTTDDGWKLKIEAYCALTPDKQTDAKKKLPAFTPSVVCVNGIRRQADGEFAHTNLIQADFDVSDDFDKLFDDLCKDEHARLIFRSPSNKVKALKPSMTTPRRLKHSRRIVSSAGMV